MNLGFDPRVKPEPGTFDLDMSHPMSAGLIWANLFNGTGAVAWDLVSGQPAPITAYQWRPDGLRANGTTTFADVGAPGRFNFGANNYAVEAIINPATISNALRMMVATKDSNVSTGRSFAFEINGTAAAGTRGAVRWSHYESDSTSYAVDGAVDQLVQDRWSHVLIVRHSTTVDIFINGIKSAVTTSGLSTAGTMQTTAVNVNIGRRVYAGFQDYFIGTIGLVRFYADSEIGLNAAWLYAEPYAMLIPVQRRNWYIATGGFKAAWAIDNHNIKVGPPL